MKKSTILRAGGFVGAAGLTVALVGAGAASTGAYFTDTENGSIAGTMGSIKVAASNTSISFTKMLPGETKSATANFANTGQNVQDVWVVFNETDLGNGSATAGINSLGTYGQVEVKSGGATKFYSANLNDNTSSCAPGAGDPACAALPRAIKLADNVAPGAGSNFEFAFTPSAKFKNNQELPIVSLRYKIVATQDGIAPTNALNNALTW
jgi:hypothetical protein